jgi:hypothetical protein
MKRIDKQRKATIFASPIHRVGFANLIDSSALQSTAAQRIASHSIAEQRYSTRLRLCQISL